jgi:hypothetical protein
METQIGTNVTKFTSNGGTVQDIEARIKAFESPKVPEPTPEPVATPEVPAQVQEITTPSVTPTETTKVDIPQQFKDKDGSLDEEKIIKSNEHLQKGIAERREKLIKLNKELRGQFTVAGAKLNEEKAKAEAESVIEKINTGKLTPEEKKRIAEEFEKDPVEALLAFNRVITKQEIAPHLNKLYSLEAETRETKEIKELDDLAREDGNEWIFSEGTARFSEVFKDRPYLLQSPTPYRDALRFMERKGQQPTQAQVGPKTPILGTSKAVPPPSPVPPVSPEQELSDISRELRKAIQNKDFTRASELEKKMDILYKGRFA